MSVSNVSNVVCVYHDNCHDGLLAAAIVQRAFPGCTLRPGRYTDAVDIEDYRGKDVILVDFSWKAGMTASVASVAKSIMILDHHKTAVEELGSKLEAEMELVRLENVDVCRVLTVLDMERSGAGLAWDALMPGPRPWIVDDVEDRDLWRFAIPGSRAVHASVGACFPMTVESRAKLLDASREERSLMIAGGATILLYHNQLVDEAAKHGQRAVGFGRLGQYSGFAVAECSSISLVSDLGHELLGKFPDAPFAMVVMPEGPKGRYVSLRSADDREDVSEIAKRFGGGGHRNAAGFTTTAEIGDIAITDPRVRIVKRADICGGRAHIDEARVPVWVVAKMHAATPIVRHVYEALLNDVGSCQLQTLDIYKALDYAREHPEETAKDLADHAEVSEDAWWKLPR